MTTSNNPGCLSLLIPLRRKAEAHAKQVVDLPYRLRDDFLSLAEKEFYQALKPLLGEQLVICPKVSLDDIFFVTHPEKNNAAINRINRKHVDFLVCMARSMRPLFGIELDDSSHQRAERIERDQFVNQVFRAAGLPLAHVPVRSAYDPNELKHLINQAMRAGGGAAPEQQPSAAQTISADAPAPTCPKCGVTMVMRVARVGVNAGRQFYGCPNYPKCREVVVLKE